MNQDPRQGPCAAPIGWPRLSEGNLLDLRGPPLAGPSDARSGCHRRRSPSSSTAWLPSNRRPRRRQRLVAKERRMPVRSPHPDVDIPARRPRDVPLRQGSRRARGRARVRRRDHRRVADVSRAARAGPPDRGGARAAGDRARRRRRAVRAELPGLGGRLPRRPARERDAHQRQRALHRRRAGRPARRLPGPDGRHHRGPAGAGRGRREGGRARRRRRRRPGRRGRPRRHRRPARLHRGATRTGGRARRPRRAALLLGHLRPAQGRDPHPPQPRGEPAADARRSRQVGPGTACGRRAAVLPHLRHDLRC